MFKSTHHAACSTDSPWLERAESARLDKAKESFNSWIIYFEERYQADVHCDNHNKAMLDFLSDGIGGGLIKSYEEFCQLSKLLSEMGYKTSTPPCDKSDYDRAIKKRVERRERSEHTEMELARLLQGGSAHSSSTGSNCYGLFSPDPQLRRYYDSFEDRIYDFSMMRERSFGWKGI